MIHECTPHCPNLPYTERVYERLIDPNHKLFNKPAGEYSWRNAQEPNKKCDFVYIVMLLVVIWLLKNMK
jgi:hypothetical protein